MPKIILVAAPLALVSLLSLGCGAELEPPRDASDAPVPVVERVKAQDTFWMAQQAAQLQEKPLQRRPSLSLGYVGQGKLAGGVGRDDEVQVPRGARRGPTTWQDYMSSPSWRAPVDERNRGPACRRCGYGSSGYSIAPGTTPADY